MNGTTTIANSGTLTLTGGTLTSAIGNYNSTAGKTVIDASNGTVTANADISANNVELKTGTLNLNKGTFDNIAKLEAKGGALSTVNPGETNNITDTDLGAFYLISDMNWSLDINLDGRVADRLLADELNRTDNKQAQFY